MFLIILVKGPPWQKRSDARLTVLGFRVRVSVTPCEFRSGRNEVWVGFSRDFFSFTLPKNHSTISPHLAH